MNNYRPFAGITPAVKIIIIINVLVFLAINMIGQRANVDLVNILGMHLPQSQYFQIYQYITHMFTQKELTHLFFNMFAVFMFGRILESDGTVRQTVNKLIDERIFALTQLVRCSVCSDFSAGNHIDVICDAERFLNVVRDDQTC